MWLGKARFVNRLRILILLCSLLATSAGALAQQPNPTGPMPPGHPPVGGAPQGPGSGEGAGFPDATMMAGDLAPGTIEARIVDQNEQPLSGTEVRLGILRQTVAEGEERTHRTATTSADGIVRFERLETGSDHTYRVTVQRDPPVGDSSASPAQYASEPFSLTREAGQRVLLHVYPATSDVNQTVIGFSGVVVVEPRDDVFQFQVMFRVFNMGRVTWVPNDVTLDLPKGFKAFTPQESATDARFVIGDGRVKLLGTFSPGEQDVSFTFQVPNDHDENVEFRLSMPPHVADMRVIAEAARGMGLEVAGFEPAQMTPSPGGQRVLRTGRRLKPGDEPLQTLTIRLTGVPSPGPGRYIAALLAAVAALIGLGAAVARPEHDRRALARDTEQARRLLLDELIALEKAKRADLVGPRTYESTRRTLLDALARLEADHPTKKPRRKSTGLATTALR
jgi:hypothetical protein